MPETTTTRVGLLAEVSGDYFNARLISEDESVAQRALGSGARLGQVGSYLAVHQADTRTLVMVERSYRLADRQGQAAHMVRLTPLGEISAAGEFSRGVSS